MMNQPDLDLHQKLSIAFSTNTGTESYSFQRKRSHSVSSSDSVEAFLCFQDPCRHVDDLVGNDIWRKFELAGTPPLSPRQRSQTDSLPVECKESTTACHVDPVQHMSPAAPLSPPDSDDSDGESEIAEVTSEGEKVTEYDHNVLKDCMWSSSRQTVSSVTSPLPVCVNRPSLAASVNSSDKETVPDSSVALCDNSDGSTPFPFPLNSQSPLYSPCRKYSVSSTDGEEDLDVIAAELESQPAKLCSGGKSPMSPPTSLPAASSVIYRSPILSLPVCSATANTPPATPSAGTPELEMPAQSSSLAAATPAATPTTSISPSPVGSPCSAGLRPQGLPFQAAPSPLEPAVKRIRRECTPSPNNLLSPVEDEDPEMKRATHNVLERRRREDLKVMYANLRCSLPDLELKDKAAKVKILERANGFIQHLVREKSNLDDNFKVLQRRNCQLRQLLASRRSNKS